MTDYLIDSEYLSILVYINCFGINLNNSVEQKLKAIVISSGIVIRTMLLSVVLTATSIVKKAN